MEFPKLPGLLAHKTKVLVSFLALGAAGLSQSATQAGEMLPPQFPDILTVNGEQSVYLPDFSYAGYGFGLETPPVMTGTEVNLTSYGAIANDEIDDSAALLNALAAAADIDGPVIINLPPGKLILSEIFVINRSHIVIRGAGQGEGGTELHFPRPLAMVDRTDKLDELRTYLVKYDKRQREKDKNIDTLFSEYSWTGGFFWIQKDGERAAPYLEEYDTASVAISDILAGTRGGFELTLADGSTLQPGQIIQIEWYNKDGETGAIIDEIYGDTDLKVGSHHWSFPNRPLVRQRTQIVSVDSNRVTIADPLLHNIRGDVPATLAEWSPLTDVGLEDFRISFPKGPTFGHHLEQGYNGIYMTSVFNGWIRDVTIENADSGILTYNSANLTISGITTTGTRTAHYAVHAGNVHNVLVRDLKVFNPVRHSLSVNTQSTRTVFSGAEVFTAPVLDQHAGSNHQNLFDNVIFHITAQRDENGAHYPVWDGSGAGYWQPGHGRFNTTWNLQIIVEGGASRGETLRLEGLAEGPDARLVGIYANRPIEIDYRPAPYTEMIGGARLAVPSLYDWQLEQRLKPAQ